MKRVTDLVDSVRDLVQLQIKDLGRALHGEGNFALCCVHATPREPLNIY